MGKTLFRGEGSDMKDLEKGEGMVLPQFIVEHKKQKYAIFSV